MIMLLFSNLVKLKAVIVNDVENALGIFSLTGAAFNCSSYQHPRRYRITNRDMLPAEGSNSDWEIST